MEQKELQRRVLIKMVNNPFTFLPFLFGFTATVASLVLGAPIMVPIFSIIAGTVLSIGSFLTLGLCKSKEIADLIVERESDRIMNEKTVRLDNLRMDLNRDQDRRTDRAFKDLDCLMRAYEGSKAFQGDLATNLEISSGIERLSEQCLSYLSKSFELYKASVNLSSGPAKRAMIKQREKIIDEVEKSVQKLGQIIAESQTIGTSLDPEGSSLSQVRDELDRHLQIAKEIDDWSHNIGSSHESFLKD